MIPPQLQRLGFRFIKCVGKRPIETNWTETANYSHDNESLQSWIKKGNNYGVMGGRAGLIIIDFDSQEAWEKYGQKLPLTFTVRTATRKMPHLYYFVDGSVTSFKIKDVDIQGDGKMVVGPGSRIEGKEYVIEKDLPINTIRRSELEQVFNITPEQPERKEVDTSRSGKEWRELCKLIKAAQRKGELDKDWIFNQMNFYSKWKDSPPQYKELTWTKALDYIQKEKKKNEPLPDPNITITPPQKVTVVNANHSVSQELSKEELNLLKNPELLEIINKEFDKEIVREHQSRKSIFLNACGKWVTNASIASYNLCLNSNSGAGKDFIAKKVLDILPKQDVVKRSRISPTVFTYWHNSAIEPNWTWNGKALLLSDISNPVMNCEVFKLLLSDETHSTVVINQEARDIEIKGKPIMFITTASANPDNEMLRRTPFLELDETVDQTKAIKKKQAEMAANGEKLGYNPLIASALGKLQKVKVKIPFAPDLVESFPDSHIIMRTHFTRLLDYIKASAALHQYQRETDEEGFLLATTDDYDNATIPLTATTSNPMMIPLTKKQKMLLEECKKLGDFCVKDLEPHVPFLVQSKIYEALGKLQELGFLSSYILDIEEKKRPVRYYSYVAFEIAKIPKWNEIGNCRKKGIKGVGGKEGIEGIEGKDTNSPHSLNSPPLLTQDFNRKEEKSSLVMLSDAVLMPCSRCGTTELPCKWKDKQGNLFCDVCKEVLTLEELEGKEAKE